MKASFTKPIFAVAAALVSAAFASGCPIYSDDSGYPAAECRLATDCPLEYQCSGGYCVPAPPIGGRKDASSDAPASDTGPSTEGSAGAYCGNPNDCNAGETCSADGTCHPGDCTANGCVNQFQCAMVQNPPGPACVHADSQACAADHQCAKTARCVDGRCTPVADLCTDRSQCPSGAACADGKCVAACTTDSQCPAGFLCRLALGICDAAAKACTITADCGGRDSVCVDGACVPRCGVVGSCSDGGAGACVDNGCVPSQKHTEACAADGSTAGCAAGQICVHHACYTSCAAPNAGACAAIAATPLCKTVTVGAATFSICGTTSTLGSECDLTQDKACAAGKSCIDGFCR
jgi:Cys-rich repeat protein